MEYHLVIWKSILQNQSQQIKDLYGYSVIYLRSI